jgi:putative FmdB family regulatory protein
VTGFAMPMYEFKCKQCGQQYEELVRNNEEKVSCPKCGSDQTYKLISTFAPKMAGGAAPSCSTGGCGGGGFS